MSTVALAGRFWCPSGMGISRPMTQLLMLSTSLVFSIGVAGCSMRDGMNDNCEWPSEPATALDLRTPAHARHLVDDVRVAEELAIRYDDLRLAHGPAAPDKPRTRDDR